MKKRVSVLLAIFLAAILSVPAVHAENVYYETTADANLRSGAGTNYGIVTTVPKGDVVVITSMWYKEWWKVKYTNSSNISCEGYIKSEYLKATSKRGNDKSNKAPLGCYTTLSELNLRSGPSGSNKAVTVVPKGNVVDVTNTIDEKWFGCTFINSKGKKYVGYISADFLKKAAEPYIVKTKTELRKGASSYSNNLYSLPGGSYLFVTAFYNSEWYKVEYTDINGKLFSGYVLKNKLKKGIVTNEPYKQTRPGTDTLPKTTLSSVKWDKKNKMVIIKWKKNTKGKGYELHFSKKKNFSKIERKFAIKKKSISSRTLSGIPKGTYYVRIRTVKGKQHSDWSAIKSVKVK